MTTKRHWTQLPRNRELVMKIARKMKRARQAKMTARVPAKSTAGRKTLSTVPATSVLSPYVRKGAEGLCQMCAKPITAHVGKHGEWLGCQSQAIGQKTPLILIADRRQEGKRQKAAGAAKTPARAKAADMAQVVPQPILAASVPRYTHTRYVALVGVSNPGVKELTERDNQIFRLIAQSKQGRGRAKLLADLKTTRTGIVDGAVRRLRLKNLVVSTS